MLLLWGIKQLLPYLSSIKFVIDKHITSMGTMILTINPAHLHSAVRWMFRSSKKTTVSHKLSPGKSAFVLNTSEDEITDNLTKDV